MEMLSPSGDVVRIEPFGQDSLRVRAVPPGGHIRDDIPGALLSPSEQSIVINNRTLTNGNIEGTIGVDGLVVIHRVSDGKIILKELARTFTPKNKPFSLASLSLSSVPSEQIYGFGEHQHGLLNNKGQSYDMESCLEYGKSKGGEVCLPFILGAQGNDPDCVTIHHNGCYQDSSSRILPFNVVPGYNDPTMTIEKCMLLCDNIGQDFSGNEAGTQCYCGTVLPDPSKKLPDSQCNYPCAGNKTELCGGDWKADIRNFTCSGGSRRIQYGFLWNMPNYGGVIFAPKMTNWTAHASSQLDYFITTSSKQADTNPAQAPADILHNYVDAVGHTPQFPEYAAGYWHSRNRYATQKELLEAAEGFANRSVPVSVIVIDYHHWIHMGDWSFNPAQWPDVPGMVQKLTQLGMYVMVSAWPFSAVDSTSFANVSNGLAVLNENKTAPVWWDDNNCNAKCYLYDPTQKKARQYIWSRLNAGYYHYGIKIFWLDASEPEISTSDATRAAYDSQLSLGSMQQIGMMYPYFHTQMVAEGLASEGEKEWIMLTRSAWAGMQRWGAALWSGDTHSTWKSLQVSIAAGLNTQLSGIGWWTTDIGGYSGGKPSDPEFRELIVRWFQYGAFCPLFRQHGARDTAIWGYGNDSYTAIVKMIELRVQMKDYIMRQMKILSDSGFPINRPMWWDYPEDHQSWGIIDQFMFGSDYLVAPVYVYKARSRSVYLPTGKWFHYFSGRHYEGGKTYNISAPFDEIPLFKKA